jgi:hypothetical protein
MAFKPQPLLFQALCFCVNRINLLIHPRRLQFSARPLRAVCSAPSRRFFSRNDPSSRTAHPENVLIALRLGMTRLQMSSCAFVRFPLFF